MRKKKTFIPKRGGTPKPGRTPAAAKKPAIRPAGHTLDEKRILAVLEKSPDEQFSSRELLRLSKVKSKTAFYGALHKLEGSGDIAVDQKHRVRYLPPEKDIKAQLVSLSSGFGFARTEDGKDIFVPGSSLKGAFVGDRVVLTGVKDQEKGLFGKIKRVDERGKNSVTGTIRVDERGAHVVPDAAIRFNLDVSPRDLNGAKDGDKVAVTPKLDKRGDWRYAKVNSIFGDSQSARVCADAIIEAAGIPNAFSETVLLQAETAANRPITEEETAARLDLRGEPIFTIDGADAKDLDDAICVKKTPEGFELGVHIADVSHYVKENTALDKEAFARGTSVYFADRVIPMLPEALSNGSCSLTAETDKLAFSAIIRFDETGEMQDYAFHKTVIRSVVRGVYSEVNRIFDGTADPELREKYGAVLPGLQAARELALILRDRAKARGEMEIESGELRFVLDENGKCVDIKPRTTGEAEQLIEQMMISANIAAARFSQKNELPFLYRVHEKPQPDKVSDLCELLDRLGIDCKEIKKSKPSAEDFGVLLERVKGTPKAELVSQRVLRTMDKARYSDEELGHFGLSLQDYSHFTSPIRRYPDTSIHRIMTAFLSGMPKSKLWKKYGDFAKESAAESSKNEIRAVSAERAAESCYAAEYAKLHIGEKHEGIISGATARGIFVRLQTGIEGFVSMADFDGADFVFDGAVSHRDARGGKTLTVGDPIRIVIASGDVSSGRIDFMPDEAE